MIGESPCSQIPEQLPLQSHRDPTQLAPGFRFHPTDEELVSYYLKRKVTGRPIRVDAISEVDLYRAEPWDLPPLSRLRSRDLEWYFFTSLDRKYSNRCRTNRATMEGYWKTTGKDRLIRGRSRTIGMKKTLVYHAGRAPRGQRTNWVMHEYRLEDEDLSRSGIQLDGYVVCKIFQKTGSGPQNGAQYGAPFIEEEWEMEGDEDVNQAPVNAAKDDSHMDPGVRGFVQLGDFLLEPDSGIQHLNFVPHSARSDDEDDDLYTEDPSSFLVESLKEQDSDGDMLPGADLTTLQDCKTSSNRLGRKKSLEFQSNSSSSQNNEYVQLKDIFGEENTSSIRGDIESIGCFFETSNINSVVDEAGHSEVFRNSNVVMDQPDAHDYCLQTDNLDNVPSQYSSGQLTNANSVYYDAVSHELPYLEDELITETSLVPMAELDFLDELMAYYDATEDNINYLPPDSFQPQFEPCASSKVVAGSSSSNEVHVHENLVADEFLPSVGEANDPSSGWNNKFIKDVVDLKDCQEKTLTKRLANMLDAISAPPALADEAAVIGKFVGKSSAASTDAVRLTAGMIQIHCLNPIGYSESWTLQKHSEMGVLSYGKRMNGAFFSALFWGGFHIFLFSVFVLALTYKLGVCVYNL